MSESSVSVVIPTYNRADWLPATVRSAQTQSLAPLEVIVVDDGSTDATSEVAGTLPGVRLISTPNRGVAAARNAGAAAARGEWLAFLDCEDLWEPEKLELQLRVLSAARDIDWCISDCTVIDPSGRLVPGTQGFRRVFALFQDIGTDPALFFARHLAPLDSVPGLEGIQAFVGDAFRLLFYGNVVLPSSALVRRSVFESLGGFDPQWRMAEETEFFHRLAAGHHGAVVMKSLVRYRVGQSQHLTSPANTRTLVLRALESLDRAAALRPLIPAESEAHQSGRARLLLHLAWTALSNYEPGQARDALAQLPSGARWSRRATTLRLLSQLPPSGLRLLHTIKRGVR